MARLLVHVTETSSFGSVGDLLGIYHTRLTGDGCLVAQRPPGPLDECVGGVCLAEKSFPSICPFYTCNIVGAISFYVIKMYERLKDDRGMTQSMTIVIGALMYT